MKTKILIPVFYLFFISFLSSCSKDDDNEIKLSERKEYSYTTLSTIPDNGIDNLIITLNVPDNRIIIDPTKVKVEFKLEHGFASDLLVQYKNPDGNFKDIFVFEGGSNTFIPQNPLLFGSTHTKFLFDIIDGNKIAVGNYNSISSDMDLYPVERPLFSQTNNKNIQGNWIFFISDAAHTTHSGKVHSIKLIFEEGALNVIY